MKNKILTLLPVITILALVCLFYKIAYAQNLTEHPATPEVFNEPGAKLLITEVNLKNKEADWVELSYESPTLKPLNLKNFRFQDDNVFKEITSDYWISSGEYHVMKFKSTAPDNRQNRLLTTARTGLTSTTEQIILKDPGGKIIDALCWSSAAPTAEETKDMVDLFQNEGWISANPASCFQSANISTNQSLIRTGVMDTDSVNDWTVTDDPTPGTANDGTPALVTTNQPAPENSTAATETNNTPSPITTISSPPPPSQKTTVKKTETPKTATAKTKTTATKTTTAKTTTAKKTATKKTAKKKYENGDLSDNIVISEIFPRAAKDDRNNEWIELTNTGDTEINLGNWQLDDMEGGSKPYTLPDTLTIAAQSSIVIKAPESKLSLSNTKDQVRLFDHTGKLLQTVEFEEAPKEQSYARITVSRDDAGLPDDAGSTSEVSTQESENPEETFWVWENQPTPGEPNPVYLELSGTITKEATFEEKYSFSMKDRNGRDHTILFTEALVAGPMAKVTFTAGTEIRILGIQTSGETSVIELKKYEVLNAGTAAPAPPSPWTLLGLIPPGGVGAWYGLKKLKKMYGKI